MPTCICGTTLEGRRRKCDACKTGPLRSGPVPPTTAAAASVPSAEVPLGLKDRGRLLWESLGLSMDSAAGHLALEACRTADRLDELDRVIAGKGVLELLRFRLNPSWWDDEGAEHVTVKVEFSNVLGSASTQQAAFRGLLDAVAARSTAATGPPKATGQPAASPLDEVRQRREARGGK